MPEFSRHFKSTGAHNTVTVDGRDQARFETGFIWSRPYAARLLECREDGGGIVVTALHDGYAQGREPVIHQRSVRADASGRIEVLDTFQGKGVHDFELRFLLHPDARAFPENGGRRIENRGEAVFLKLEDGDPECRPGGETAPVFGWYSPAYGVKQPCPVLACRKRGAPDAVSFRVLLVADGWNGS